MSANFPSQVDSTSVYPAQLPDKDSRFSLSQPSFLEKPFKRRPSKVSLRSEDSVSFSQASSQPSTPGYGQISSQSSAHTSTTTVNQDDTFSKKSSHSSSSSVDKLSTKPSSIDSTDIARNTRINELKSAIQAILSPSTKTVSAKAEHTKSTPSINIEAPLKTTEDAKINSNDKDHNKPENHKLRKRSKRRKASEQILSKPKVETQTPVQEESLFSQKSTSASQLSTPENSTASIEKNSPKKRFTRKKKKNPVSTENTVKPEPKQPEPPHKLHKKASVAIQAADPTPETVKYTGLMAKALKRARYEKPHKVGNIIGTRNPSEAHIEAAFEYYEFCKEAGFDITEHGLARVIQDGQGKEAKVALQQALSNTTQADEHEIMFHKKHGSIVSRSFLPDGNALVTPIDLARRTPKYPRGQIITVYPRVPTFKKANATQSSGIRIGNSLTQIDSEKIDLLTASKQEIVNFLNKCKLKLKP